MKISNLLTLERADSPDARVLVAELDAELGQFYPQESQHGYSVDKLLREGVAFFVLRQDGNPAGCGGVQLYGKVYGELKRMYVRPQYRGQGLSRLILQRLIDYTRERGVALLRLETGIHQLAAIKIYEKFGFHQIPPFGEYKPDPLSLFLEKQLTVPGD